MELSVIYLHMRERERERERLFPSKGDKILAYALQRITPLWTKTLFPLNLAPVAHALNSSYLGG
jgi:hypothetical protein